MKDKTADEQATLDSTKVKELSVAVGIRSEDVVTSFRDGAPKSDGKARIIKVKFENASARLAFLRQASKILKDAPEYSSLKWKPFTRPDLTYLERVEDGKLRAELERWRQDKHDAVIYKGKVMLRVDRDKLRPQHKPNEGTVDPGQEN